MEAKIIAVLAESAPPAVCNRSALSNDDVYDPLRRARGWWRPLARPTDFRGRPPPDSTVRRQQTPSTPVLLHTPRPNGGSGAPNLADCGAVPPARRNQCENPMPYSSQEIRRGRLAPQHRAGEHTERIAAAVARVRFVALLLPSSTFGVCSLPFSPPTGCEGRRRAAHGRRDPRPAGVGARQGAEDVEGRARVLRGAARRLPVAAGGAPLRALPPPSAAFPPH